MTGAQYIVDSLIKRGVTDAFGIPGGVILPLLYEFDNRRSDLEPHLSYHEQCAGFAACGYAQASGKLGVAYSTRGPGFTNLITAIADAYYDSLPVLFITAHSAPCPPNGMRVMADQEMDTCSMVRNITKKAARLDDPMSFADDFEELCETALNGRKGPVFLDVSTKVLSQEINNNATVVTESKCHPGFFEAGSIVEAIRNAKRPVILAGDGINQADARELFQQFCKKSNIPVISSRFTHDILEGSDQYCGYVGSHGMRCANFILSKTDLILSIGNRLHFPPKSESFGGILEQARIIRCEIDEGEFNRNIPNTTIVQADLRDVLCSLCQVEDYGNHTEWINVCNILKEELSKADMNPAVESISNILDKIPSYYTISNDVGNNEFWVSRACVQSGIKNRTYYSKSFGALGCGLGKAIGIYHATRHPVLCFVGDQGLQMNIQELQYISQHQLPISIVLLNNQSSGMIKDRESLVYNRLVHTSSDSGYRFPDFKVICEAYGIGYYSANIREQLFQKTPSFIEIKIDETLSLSPSLPRGKKCQDMLPSLSIELYDYLNTL